MLRYIIVLLSVSFLSVSGVFAQRVESPPEPEKKEEGRIQWVSTSLLVVDSVVDGYRRVPYDTKLERIILCFEDAGTSDSTGFDIKRVDAPDTMRSILGYGDFPYVRAGDTRGCLEWIPNRRIDLLEGDVLRADITMIAGGKPKNFCLQIYFKKGHPKK